MFKSEIFECVCDWSEKNCTRRGGSAAGILLAAPLFATRAGGLRAPKARVVNRGRTKVMNRRCRRFFLLLFLAGNHADAAEWERVEIRHWGVVSYRLAGESVKSPLGHRAVGEDSGSSASTLEARQLWLDLPSCPVPHDRTGNNFPPASGRLLHMNRGFTSPMPERTEHDSSWN